MFTIKGHKEKAMEEGSQNGLHNVRDNKKSRAEEAELL
jgi:hypothetical protein